MKKVAAILDGKEIEVLVELDKEDFEISEPLTDELEQTLDLTKTLENTQIINVGDNNG